MALLESKLPCPDCGSSDALHLYENGSHCFSCGKTSITNKKDKENQEVKPLTDISYVEEFPFAALPDRGITEETARKYGVRVEYNESTGYPYPVLQRWEGMRL